MSYVMNMKKMEDVRCKIKQFVQEVTRGRILNDTWGSFAAAQGGAACALGGGRREGAPRWPLGPAPPRDVTGRGTLARVRLEPACSSARLLPRGAPWSRGGKWLLGGERGHGDNRGLGRFVCHGEEFGAQ